MGLFWQLRTVHQPYLLSYVLLQKATCLLRFCPQPIFEGGGDFMLVINLGLTFFGSSLSLPKRAGLVRYARNMVCSKIFQINESRIYEIRDAGFIIKVFTFFLLFHLHPCSNSNPPSRGDGVVMHALSITAWQEGKMPCLLLLFLLFLFSHGA